MATMAQFYWLVLGVLSVWRVTHLLNAEDGPWQAVVGLRRLAGSGFWGELMDCFLCLSLWVSVPLALTLGDSWRERLMLWPALSGGAILLQRATAPAPEPPPSVDLQTEETTDVLREP
jgi:hypothetical protein